MPGSAAVPADGLAAGWIKTVGNLRKTRHRGTKLVDWIFILGMAAYNLIRIRNLTMA